MDSLPLDLQNLVGEKKPVVQLERINREITNISEDSGFSSTSDGSVNLESGVPTIKENNNAIDSEEIKFVDAEFVTKDLGIDIKKRKPFWTTELLEQKRLDREAYERDIQEKQYKRLMHLLTQSKAFTNFMSTRFNERLKTKNKKIGGKRKLTAENQDSSSPKKEKLSADAIFKMKENDNKKNKLRLSDDDIQKELSSMSEEDSSNKENIDFSDNFVQPKYFLGKLRPYQKEGLNWLKILYENGLNGILADEMGLGKTVQIIALFAHLIEKQISGPFLIIVPLSTLGNWVSEFQRFAPKIPVVVYYGRNETKNSIKDKISRRVHISSSCSTHPVILTTYQMVMNNDYFLKLFHFKYMVIDEAQRIKNTRCRLLKILKQLESVNRLLLTGTPLQNNLSELWSLLNFLLPDIFNDLEVFQAWFDAKQLQDENEKKKLFKQEEEKHILSTLREILQPFMLRRLKEDVCKDIPINKEIIIYTPLTELQYDLYSSVLNRHFNKHYSEELESVIIDVDGVRPKRKCTNKIDFEKGCYKSNIGTSETQRIGNADINSVDYKEWNKYTDVTEKNVNYLIKIKYMNYVSVYKHIVNHPYILYNPLIDPSEGKTINDLVKDSGKMIVLDMMLRKLKSNNHKILLFSTMSMVLNILEDYLSWKNYKYVRLDGSVLHAARQENINKFNTDPNTFIFLLTTKAGGVGLNLTAADTVIIYDSDWNPQNDIQAMARCHRIGQTKPVAVYRLCNKGTIDELIMKRANAKRFLEKAIISKEEFSVNNKEDILKLKNLLDNDAFKVFYTDAELNELLDRSNW
ncbi:PREDICTED: lymphoid-specific helicase-like [Ceratosolen solmsi marchali]|uniref:Lymphoid-specific helicase-like n=1 Tax=Ceratosolen solmsi marchali TaxID=326594 RepID=A0AAJ6YB07_9HYME|nr:PREDICTED: lymphoid-specific helicase-like [Ceratosolen solmsi marchali]